MQRSTYPPDNRGLLLGIEGGATRTVMLLSTTALELRRRLEAGPGNVQLLSDAELVCLFKCVPPTKVPIRAIGIGMAGARSSTDRDRIRKAADSVWPGVPCTVTHDLETALTAAEVEIRSQGKPGGSRVPGPCSLRRVRLNEARVLVLSGTGSCCWGRTASGKTARVGGWGHGLGDRGSAYSIAHGTLRQVILAFDRSGRWPPLGRDLLRKVGLNEPEDFIAWFGNADKATVADLAIEVFRAAAAGDSLARSLLHQEAQALAADALACAHRLAGPSDAVTFIFAGSTLLRQPEYARRLGRAIRLGRSGCNTIALRQEGAWGAVLLAARLVRAPVAEQQVAPVIQPGGVRRTRTGSYPDLSLLAVSPTEQRNRRSVHLDRLPLRKSIDLFLSEESRVAAGLRKEKAAITRACRAITAGLKQGGRLFYVGAGTSGRLGVLDASECPPTFCSPPDQVQGIIAGGARALLEAVEGAEDDAGGGERAVLYRGVGRRDVVVGIAASGRTPFVWGALNAARELGAATILITFNPTLKRRLQQRPDIVIAPDVGPELLTGSTRLKAGSATKLLLNMFSTLAMVGMGKVLGNWMIDLNPSNTKLRDRATRLVQAITGSERADAERALRRTNWIVRRAIHDLTV